MLGQALHTPFHPVRQRRSGLFMVLLKANNITDGMLKIAGRAVIQGVSAHFDGIPFVF